MKQEGFHIGLGIFIVFAFLIAIATGVTLYKQYLQGKIESYVMFFKGSLNGLEAGSPILYRGVQIGKVNRIELTANKSQTNVAIPVYVEFFLEKSFKQRQNPLKILIKNGIVAKISSPPLFGGKTTIRLVPARPNIEINKKTTTWHGFARFPTQSSSEKRISLNSALRAAEKTFSDLSQFLQSRKMTEMLAAFTKMANGVQNFADKINSENISDMLASISKMSRAVSISAKDISSELPNVAANLNKSLNDFSEAAYSAKNLTDYLARHPESLLRGKT